MDALPLLLHADPTAWLFEPQNPSVRFFALRDLLGRPAHDPELLAARAEIMQRGPVPAILARQTPAGFWGKAEDFYIRSKYRGTVWTFQVLAELGADGSDPRIQRACEFVLSASQERASRGFSYQSDPLGSGGGDSDSTLPCLTGNMLFALIRFGYLCDPRVQAGIEWILRYQRFDDGDCPAPRGWPYDRRRNCWGKHTCHIGVVKALKALAEIPPDQRTDEVSGLIQMLVEYLLKHRLHMSSHHPDQVAMPEWLEFGFPRFWSSDDLEVLLLLTRLGYRDPRMQLAVDGLLSKQDGQGRWTMEFSYNDRMLVSIERKSQPSKWVTLWALFVLRRYFS
jgi:hypothetical protein